MAQIGQFVRTQSGYAGRVRTITLDLELAFVPCAKSDAEKAPDYRIHLGDEDGPEVGAAWLDSNEKDGTYISVVLDDPSFAQPVRARMRQNDETGRDWALRWMRPRKREEQD